MRGLLGNLSFTVPVFAGVVVTAAFAFFLDAPSQLVALMLLFTVFTALFEHRLLRTSWDGNNRAPNKSKIPP